MHDKLCICVTVTDQKVLGFFFLSTESHKYIDVFLLRKGSNRSARTNRPILKCDPNFPVTSVKYVLFLFCFVFLGG